MIIYFKIILELILSDIIWYFKDIYDQILMLISTPGLILKLVMSDTELGGHLISRILVWILISKASKVFVPKLF
jgi:hypothetical protein